MKIICVGRNYRAHAEELGNAVPEVPVIFCKPDSALLPPRNPFVIPPWTQDVHHEIEWVQSLRKDWLQANRPPLVETAHRLR